MVNTQPVGSSMEGSSNDDSANKLKETLLDAVTHSRALFNLLEDQKCTIESLRRENDKLRYEIDQWKNATPDVTAQLDHLFQQNAAKQAKIESLKADLRAAKGEGARASASSKGPLSPAPAVSSDDVDGAPFLLPDNHTSTATLRLSPLLHLRDDEVMQSTEP
ncbi:hypothetical protein DV737_g3967, partial [Chaetothyriales sp. CBS 132003]